MAYVAGIDIGSVTAKAAIMEDDKVVSYHIAPSGANFRNAGQQVMEAALEKAGLTLSQIKGIVTTGYGAANVPYECRQVTEVSAQSRGVHHLFPSVRTVVDIGGQASKAIRVDERGRSTDFAVTEKCAAGSGRFLSVIAHVLQVPLLDIGALSLQGTKPVKFNTGCAVFSESEAISRVAEGARKEDILAGVHAAIAVKMASMLDRIRLQPDCAITGGGANDIGLVKALEEKIALKLMVPEEPLITAALRAALIARDAVVEAEKDASLSDKDRMDAMRRMREERMKERTRLINEALEREKKLRGAKY